MTSVRTQHLRADTNAFALVDGPGGQRHAVLVADGSGRLDYLKLTPVPASWAEVDRRLRALAPRASILAAEVGRDGRCRPRHGLDADRPRPMGSAFKLYVLGAVAHAVRTGTASWDEPLAVRDEWKADPGGVVGGLPAGTVLPLREYASHMIFYSDNSATDHLLHRVGRAAATDQLRRFGMRDPAANRPFLFAREMFQLKSTHYPTHADAYLALDRPGRLAYLTDVVAGLPAPTPGCGPSARHRSAPRCPCRAPRSWGWTRRAGRPAGSRAAPSPACSAAAISRPRRTVAPSWCR
jgi:beta-lactamase class A